MKDLQNHMKNKPIIFLDIDDVIVTDAQEYEKYGVDNVSQFKKFKEKRTQTIKDRYNVSHYSKSIEYRKYNEKLKKWIPLNEINEFEKYRRMVWNITKNHKTKLFSEWNNKCYYTNTKLFKNVHYNNPNYPVIDHKISIYNGFKNNINHEIIGNINNLCICSRIINSKKGILCENDFKLTLKNI